MISILRIGLLDRVVRGNFWWGLYNMSQCEPTMKKE